MEITQRHNKEGGLGNLKPSKERHGNIVGTDSEINAKKEKNAEPQKGQEILESHDSPSLEGMLYIDKVFNKSINACIYGLY